MARFRIAFAATLLAAIFNVTFSNADSLVTIGMSLPLTGDSAQFGVAAKNGVELARLQFPKQLSHIQFIYDDNQYSGKAAISSFHKFQNQSKANIVFVWGSPTCMAVAPIAEGLKKPLACFSGDEKPGYHHVFSFNSMASDYAAVIARDLSSRAPSRIGVVYTNIPFFAQLAASIGEQSNLTAKVVSKLTLDPGARDLRSEVLRLKAEKTDHLLLFLLPSQVELFLKELRIINFHPFIIGGDTFADPTVVKAAGGELAGAPYVDMVIPDDFRKQYENTFGDSAGASFAYNTFQFAIAIETVFSDRKTLESGEVEERLRHYRGSPLSENKIEFVESAKSGQYFRFPIGMNFLPGNR